MILLFLNSCQKDEEKPSSSAYSMLYIASVDLNTLTTPNTPGSHSKEIEKWKSAGYIVTTMSMAPSANTTITSELLSNYKVLRLTNYYPHNYTVAEGNVIYDWVNNGGKLFADIHYNEDINAVNAFGVDRIEGEGGGNDGNDWSYHGAPLVVGPVSGPISTINGISIEAIDRPFLKSNHQFTIAASFDGYPVVVYKSSQQGKVVITFDGGSYSLDVVHPGNSYRASITMENNMQFIENVIEYFKNGGESITKSMLYIAYQDISTLTTPNVPGSHSIEINKWKNAGYSVTTMSTMPPANLTITSELLSHYKVLRLTNYYPHNYTVEEGSAICEWVNNGGKLFADIHFDADINAVNAFGVERIDGEGGGDYGLTWYYHGAPLIVEPVTGPFSAVNAIAIEALDRPVLKSNHQLTVAATYDGYPVIVYKSSQKGKVVITFDGGSYSLDVVHPGNSYRACITMQDNMQFVSNVISYFEL
jgi:hypothetical protein